MSGTWENGWHGRHGVPWYRIRGVRICLAQSPALTGSGLTHLCNRPKGHTGRHHAHSRNEVLAVWS